MSEELNQEVSFNGETSEEVSQETTTPEQENEAESQFLTRKEAERLWQEREDSILRQTQSLTDKASSRLDKKLRDELKQMNDVIALQKQAGISITPEQERTMRQMAYDKALGQLTEDEDDSGQQPAQPTEKDDPKKVIEMASAAVIDSMVKEVYEKSGITVFENDPEVDMIDKSSPMAFIESVRNAVEKKKQRVQTAPEARITSLGKGQQTNLEAQYLEEKGKIQGDVEALINLKKTYRSKGLQV